jgi:uncharacterized protein YggU (UPF0235/DUF167 family)
VPSARLAIRLTPRAGVDRLDPPGPDGELRARVRAAPADGAANEALLRLLADSLDLPRSALRLVAGAQGRRKLVEVEGLTPEEVQARPVRRRGR